MQSNSITTADLFLKYVNIDLFRIHWKNEVLFNIKILSKIKDLIFGICIPNEIILYINKMFLVIMINEFLTINIENENIMCGCIIRQSCHRKWYKKALRSIHNKDKPFENWEVIHCNAKNNDIICHKILYKKEGVLCDGCGMIYCKRCIITWGVYTGCLTCYNMYA